MISGKTTPNGTGIILQGDFYDLDFLYSTVHTCVDLHQKGKEEPSPFAQILLNFAYELRKTKYGAREIVVFRTALNSATHDYFACPFVWTDMFAFLICLEPYKYNKRLSMLQKAHMNLLKCVVIQTLSEFDPVSAKRITEAFYLPLSANSKYSFLAFQELHLDFLRLGNGVVRTRKLSDLLLTRYLETTPHFKEFVKTTNHLAKEKGCAISALGFEEFPDIEW